MTVKSVVPFKILGAHSVPKNEIKLLEARFGLTFPGSVSGPTDMFRWAFDLLPWENQAPVLRALLVRNFEKAEISDDPRARRALLLLDGGDAPSIITLGAELYELIDALCRVRGVEFNLDAFTEEEAGPELRAWAAAHAALGAACLNLKRGARFGADWSSTGAALAVVTCTLAQSPEAFQIMATDRIVQEVVGALASYVGSWTGAWQI